ncbi:MAG: hypothetical protein GDA49_07055 [Rhodospirillales bacterium]|nr:hypothetical protein [Rhodospirillales bacterium]
MDEYVRQEQDNMLAAFAWIAEQPWCTGACGMIGISWGGQAQAYFARPPDPDVVCEAWRTLWQERLTNLPFPTATWLSHQRRDDYWKHGSVCEDWDAIECPVYAVTGWADGYTNTALKLMAGLKVPRRCLIGPLSPWLSAPCRTRARDRLSA